MSDVSEISGFTPGPSDVINRDIEIARLRREKAALVEALDTSSTMMKALATQLASWGHEIVVNYRGQLAKNAALRFATEKTTEDDDGGDPSESALLKPRGNDGIVSADICHDALLLIGDRGVTEKHVAAWTQEERDQAYDWAIRIHLAAGDNDGVFVPEPPACVLSATVSDGSNRDSKPSTTRPGWDSPFSEWKQWKQAEAATEKGEPT